MWMLLIIFVTFWSFRWNRGQFLQCHDDPPYTPEEGPLEDIQFTWLGALQYIHIKNGTPHYFRMPRVVLITRQFVLSTARDAAEVPDGFALGNIAFGDYERDELECELTIEQLTAGADCEPAAVLMPIADVMLHPEYQTLGVLDSIALMKLLTEVVSRYMVPVCLPFQNYLRSKGKGFKRQIYLVDFTNDVPRDIMNEDKEISKLSVLPKELCYIYNDAGNMTVSDPKKYICTTGCGFHVGAASILHEHTGHWTLISLALGNSLCPDPLRIGRPPQPPRHLLIYPYASWITVTISGEAVGRTAPDDPFGFVPRASPKFDPFGSEWNGHWWMGGVRCYSRGILAAKMYVFYRELFRVRPSAKPPANSTLTYYLELYAAYGTMVICVKVGLPYQLAKPTIWGLATSKVKLHIPVLSFNGSSSFQVEGFAFNTTSDESSYSDSDYDSDSDE